MVVSINLDRTKGFLYGGNNKLHVPKWFGEDNISENSKEWFQFLLLTFLATLESKIFKFEKRLDNLGIPFDNTVVDALNELEAKGYVKVDIDN